MNARNGAWPLLLMLIASSGSSSCRLLSQEVACRRDRDCPRDVSLGFCDLPGGADSGVGVCVEDDPDPSDDDSDDDAGSFTIPDGGLSDAG